MFPKLAYKLSPKLAYKLARKLAYKLAPKLAYKLAPKLARKLARKLAYKLSPKLAYKLARKLSPKSFPPAFRSRCSAIADVAGDSNQMNRGGGSPMRAYIAVIAFSARGRSARSVDVPMLRQRRR